MQIKTSLEGIPSDQNKRRSIIDSATGLLVHEIGHMITAAKQEFPSDLIIIPKNIRANEAASIIDEKFRDDMQINPLKEKSCLAGGFMAEVKIFSEPALHRARSDIVRMASIDKKRIVNDVDIRLYAEGFIEQQSDFFNIKDVINIKSVYRKIAKFIQDNPKTIEGFYILPIQIWFDIIHDKNDENAIDALSRSNDENKWYDYITQIRSV